MTRPTPSTPQWRELSEAELAATPDAKLGGTLAIIVAIAALIAAIKGLMYLLYLMFMGGPPGGGAAVILRMFAPLNGSKSALPRSRYASTAQGHSCGRGDAVR